jgi:uncharacterized protein (DUF58 family)
VSARLDGIGRAAGVALGGAALILIGLLFDTAPLFVPGVAFTALGIGLPAWTTLAARGARAERRLQTDRVVEKQRFDTTIEVSRGPLGLPGSEIFDPVTGSVVPVQSALSLVSGSNRASVTITASYSRRGRKHLAPPSVVCRDVLGLAEVVKPGDGAPDELLVLPRTEPVNWLGRNLGAYSQATPGRSSSEPLAAAELDGLRPYRVGTPASRIHWPAVARGAGLLERRMRADGSTRPLVVLDARGAEDAAEGLDAAVRAAGSIVLELARRGGCGLLMPGERRPIEVDPDLTRWPVAHLRLALIEPRPDGKGAHPPQLRSASRLGRVFYVAVEPPRRLPHALSGHAQLPPVLVLPAGVEPRARAAVVFEVAGCRGYVLGVQRPAPAAAASVREPVV